jgi:hypothetical protein
VSGLLMPPPDVTLNSIPEPPATIGYAEMRKDALRGFANSIVRRFKRNTRD